MADKGKQIFSKYTEGLDVEVERSLPTFKQHVMHDFFRRQREAEDDISEGIPALDTSAKSNESRRRKNKNRQATGQPRPLRSSVKTTLRAHKGDPRLHRESSSWSTGLAAHSGNDSQYAHGTGLETPEQNDFLNVVVEQTGPETCKEQPEASAGELETPPSMPRTPQFSDYDTRNRNSATGSWGQEQAWEQEQSHRTIIDFTSIPKMETTEPTTVGERLHYMQLSLANGFKSDVHSNPSVPSESPEQSRTAWISNPSSDTSPGNSGLGNSADSGQQFWSDHQSLENLHHSEPFAATERPPYRTTNLQARCLGAMGSEAQRNDSILRSHQRGQNDAMVVSEAIASNETREAREQSMADFGDANQLSVNPLLCLRSSSRDSSCEVEDDTLLLLEISVVRQRLLNHFRSATINHSSSRNIGSFFAFQHRLTDNESVTSSSEKQSTARTSQTSSTSSCLAYVDSSRKSLKRGKQKEDDLSDDEDHRKRRARMNLEPSEQWPCKRLACLYNKYDPMMYRSNAQTHRKFEICESHDFQGMNKLYEHLKRVHGDQPPQCPRCTRTDFNSSGELQAHQTATQSCTLVPVARVRRIQWITQEKRKALQVEINRNLRGRTEEEKWKFAYRWLFPDTTSNDTPSPYLQDYVISIVSSVIDDYEQHLSDLIRQSNDLDELESQIPSVRGHFLAQYGISAEHGGFPSNNQPIHSDSSSQTSAVRAPLDMDQFDQSRTVMNENNHDQLALPSASNDISQGHDLANFTFLQPPLIYPSYNDWERNNSFATSMNDLYDWPTLHESSNAMGTRNGIPELSSQTDEFPLFTL